MMAPTAIRASFDRDYKRRYGHADARAAAEFQALHLSAFARLRRPELERLPRAAMELVPPIRGRCISATACAATRTFTARLRWHPVFRADGPALIEEYGSTTLVWPGDRFKIGALREIRIDCAVQ